MENLDRGEDNAIVSAVLAGDVEQYADLVGRYWRPLFQVAKSRLQRADLAEEAVQEAFVCAYKSLHTFNPTYSFRTWLWTILLNQCRRHGERFARLPMQSADEMVDDAPLVMASTAPSAPDLQAMIRERNELLEDCLRRLPPQQADAIRLRFFGHLKFREIADAMKCSLGAAKKRVRDGLTTISKLLRDARLTDSVFPGDRT